MNENWGGNKGFKLLEKYSIQREEYRDGSLNGNACKKLLLKLASIKPQVPKRLWKYISALEAFEKVRISCFSQILHSNFKEDITKFAKAYDKLDIPRTNKVHILIDHVPDFCEKHQRGLGYFSEQAR